MDRKKRMYKGRQNRAIQRRDLRTRWESLRFRVGRRRGLSLNSSEDVREGEGGEKVWESMEERTRGVYREEEVGVTLERRRGCIFVCFSLLCAVLLLLKLMLSCTCRLFRCGK